MVKMSVVVSACWRVFAPGAVHVGTVWVVDGKRELKGRLDFELIFAMARLL